jgi:type IV pilus assembly protein PilQ
MQRVIQLGIVAINVFPVLGWAAQITSVDFKGTEDPSEITIRSDGPVTFEKQENTNDKQVVLELKGATISKANSRKIDTSSFNSNVSLISPYQVEGQADTVRVVVQMRNSGPVDVSQDGNLIRVKVSGVGGGESTAAAGDGATPDSSTFASTPDASAPGADAPANSSSTDPQNSANTKKTTLDEYVENRTARKFSGRPITLQLRDVDLSDVFRMIGEASGFNIIVGDDVKGKITLSLVDVPWDQALDVVLHSARLGAERSNNILRIGTLQGLTQEKLDEYRAKKAAEANTPQVTRVFPISFSNLTDLQGLLTKFTAGISSMVGASVPGAADLAPPQAIVQVDNRTNSIIVRDLPDNIERMRKLIEILDTQTPQVMIEAKVVEASESFGKSLSGSLGLGNGGSGSQFFASMAGANPVDSLIGSATTTSSVFPTGTDVGLRSAPEAGAPNGTFGLSPNVSFIPGLGRLNAILSWGESESQVKIVASPRTVVLSKEKATIVQGTPVLIPGTTTVAGVGTVATTSVQSANVSLSVKPSVTNEGSVLLDLEIKKDVPMPLAGGSGQQGIGTRNINTLVLVESGSTLVIGGIYTVQNNQSGSGFPFLRKLPILGALFGQSNDSTDRTELFIFITPRIINMKEAGLNI